MKRRIIVNADDFGLVESVSEGVIEAFNNAQVSSTTLMVNTPGTEHAVGLAELHPTLGVGLHFNLTEGRSLTSASSLVDPSGTFYSRPRLLRRLLKRTVDMDHIRIEFEAQLERINELGISPTHIDSHEHVHMAPGVFNAISSVVRDRVPRLRLVNPPRQHLAHLRGFRPQAALRDALFQLSSASIRKRFSGSTNDYFVSLHQLPSDVAWTVDSYREIARSGPSDSVCELMVHPYLPGKDLEILYRDDPLRDIRRLFAERCFAEHRMLTELTPFDPAEFDLINFDRLD